VIDKRYLIHAALAGILTLPAGDADRLISKLHPGVLARLAAGLRPSGNGLLRLRDAPPAGHA